MAWPRTVRTTIQPDVPIEVGEQEYNQLSIQGILADDGSGYEETVDEIKTTRAQRAEAEGR